MLADIAELILQIIGIACLFSAVFAVYGWIGRTLSEGRITFRVTRPALPDAEGDIPFMRHAPSFTPDPEPYDATVYLVGMDGKLYRRDDGSAA